VMVGGMGCVVGSEGCSQYRKSEAEEVGSWKERVTITEGGSA